MSRAVTNQDYEAVDLHVGNCLDLAKAGLQEARRAVEALRPAELETNTLCDALELLGKLAKQQNGLRYEIQCDSTITVEARQEDELFRIAQEGIANVGKHAGASLIKIRFVRINENVVLSVADNGIGFDVNAETEGFGLRGMRERSFSIGAALRVASSPDGSLVEVSLPNRRNH